MGCRLSGSLFFICAVKKIGKRMKLLKKVA